jgi:hypothetical protein
MKTMKIWLTVSDYSEQPTSYGEYWRKKKESHLDKIKEFRLILEPLTRKNKVRK